VNQLHQSFAGGGLKLAGEFEFLGTADKGEALFDTHPPRGIVKIYHLGHDIDMNKADGGIPTRCGYFRCGRLRWGAFKRANSNWNSHTSWGKHDTIGDYPVAYTIVVPDKSPEDKAKTRDFFKRLTGGLHDG
jgi:hypothetical protein